MHAEQRIMSSTFCFVFIRFSVGVSYGMTTYGPNHSLGIQLDTTKGANRGERFTALYLDETFSPVPNGIPGAWKRDTS